MIQEIFLYLPVNFLPELNFWLFNIATRVCYCLLLKLGGLDFSNFTMAPAGLPPPTACAVFTHGRLHPPFILTLCYCCCSLSRLPVFPLPRGHSLHQSKYPLSGNNFSFLHYELCRKYCLVRQGSSLHHACQLLLPWYLPVHCTNFE